MIPVNCFAWDLAVSEARFKFIFPVVILGQETVAQGLHILERNMIFKKLK